MNYETTLPKLGTFAAPSITALYALIIECIDEGDYGVSDIGARWQVTQGNEAVGVLSYNGRYVEGWAW